MPKIQWTASGLGLPIGLIAPSLAEEAHKIELGSSLGKPKVQGPYPARGTSSKKELATKTHVLQLLQQQLRQQQQPLRQQPLPPPPPPPQQQQQQQPQPLQPQLRSQRQQQ